MKTSSFSHLVLSRFVASLLFVLPLVSSAQTTLLNVSYDVTREFYRDYDALFAAYWKHATSADVVINQSHGGARAQARAIADGLQADVVTLNQPTDIDMLAEEKLLSAKWASAFPDAASPTYSTMVLVVRHGNPKHIHDWDDLARADVSVITANPKTSGGGRCAYLAAWGYAKKKYGTDAASAAFVGKMFSHVAVLDAGSRGSTTTFVQRGIGDVLIAFESEALEIDREFDAGKVELVYPSLSIEAPNPVAVVDSVAQKHKTETLAHAYLDYLYAEPAQRLAAQHFLRVRSPTVMAQFGSTFRPLPLFRVEDVFGSWAAAQQTHFDDGGRYDQLALANAKK